MLQEGIIIAGRGNLANAIITECDLQKIRWKQWKKDLMVINPSQTVVVHVGSGRELKEVVKFCGRGVRDNSTIPLLQGSGGMRKYLPKRPKFPIIEAPNFAWPVIWFIESIPAIRALLLEKTGHGFDGVTESHQHKKETIPATGMAMAVAAGIPTSEIVSERDQRRQVALGVDPEFISGHGYHWVDTVIDGVKIVLSTQVNGRVPYAKGAIKIVGSINRMREDLKPGYYSVKGNLTLQRELMHH